MSQNRFAVILVLTALCFCASASALAAQGQPVAVRPVNNTLAARGFDELYNMDYDLAIRDFTKLRSEHPDDPFSLNYLLAAEVFKELNRIGALDTETYSGESFLTSKARRPLDPAVQKQIIDRIARVESICNARLEKNPKDTDALYARGVARGFRSTYMGLAEKSWLPALRSALAARRDHERVLELDPGYVDAKMTVGIHNYIIGSLNWAGRAAVALVGVTGNKQKGLDYLREVSRSHGTSSNDATLALSLFLRREQRYPEALELVSRVSRESPRNFLLAVEYAHLLNAAGHGREAIAQYRLALEKGREGKYSTFQPEMAAWGLAISLRGQREFEQAASAFDLVATIGGIEPSLIDRANVSAGEMYDAAGHREQAVVRYRRVIAAGRDGASLSAARKHLRHPYQANEAPASPH
jgi:tetratricopeptide (TPR) repeat protein